MVKHDYILNSYKNRVTDKESLRYLKIHSKRYAFLLNKVSILRKSFSDKYVSILDIGPSYLTEQLQKTLKNDTVYFMGYTHPESRGGQLPESVSLDPNRFIHCDLNGIQKTKPSVPEKPFSIIVFAEVIEHLYISPAIVLRYLGSILAPGGLIVLQTPNAVNLYNRLKMITGNNPFEMIRENSQNPGHYREYTKKELFSLAEECGFSVVDFIRSNYFGMDKVDIKLLLYKMLQSISGPSMKDGITIVLKKKCAGLR